MTLPCTLPSGSIIVHNGVQIRFNRMVGDDILDLTDLRTMGPYQDRDEKTGLHVAARLSWLLAECRERRLCVLAPQNQESLKGSNFFGGLDADAAAARDPRSPWRFRIAWRALAANLPKVDRVFDLWLEENYGKVEGDLDFPKPSGSSVKRWVRALEKFTARTSTLISGAGRPRGHSQLEPEVDCAVHEAALWFWTRKDASQKDAYAFLFSRIEELNRSLPPGRLVPYKMPSKEALRKRIRKLQCEETVAQKHGKAEAHRRYRGSGEPITVDHILQVAFMDSTQLEQVITFDEDWQLPATKVWITVLMDVKSHVIIGLSLFVGSPRAETSIECILDALAPPRVPEGKAEKIPILRWLFGKPAAILPDNHTGLLGPASLPGLTDLGIALLLPPVEMPTAKAALERFFRTLKQRLAILPGTVIDPKRAKDANADVLGEACMTFSQLLAIIDEVLADYHIDESTGLDGRAPAQVWEIDANARGGPALTDLNDARRLLGLSRKGLLSTNGLEYNGITYRDATAVTRLLSDIVGSAPVRSQRKDGSATAEVDFRYYPGNIDTIDVYNPLRREYATLYSTDPEYTHQLSEWEHNLFRKIAKRRNAAFCDPETRLAFRAQTLARIDAEAPHVAFQQRREMAALHLSPQIRALAGDRAAFAAAQPRHDGMAPVVELQTAEGLREDRPAAPAIPPAKRKPIRRSDIAPRLRGSAASAQFDAESSSAPLFDWSTIPDPNEDQGMMPDSDTGPSTEERDA